MVRHEGGRWDVSIKDNAIYLERISDSDEQLFDDLLAVDEARGLAGLLTKFADKLEESGDRASPRSPTSRRSPTSPRSRMTPGSLKSLRSRALSLPTSGSGRRSEARRFTLSFGGDEVSVFGSGH